MDDDAIDGIRNTLFEVRRTMGLPLVRRVVKSPLMQNLNSGLLGQQREEGQRYEKLPSTGRQKGVSENTSSSINSPETCGVKDSNASTLPSFTPSLLIRERIQSGNLTPIRSAIGSLITANTANTGRNQTEKESEKESEDERRLRKKREYKELLDIEEEERLKNFGHSLLRKGRSYE